MTTVATTSVLACRRGRAAMGCACSSDSVSGSVSSSGASPLLLIDVCPLTLSWPCLYLCLYLCPRHRHAVRLTTTQVTAAAGAHGGTTGLGMNSGDLCWIWG